MNRHVTELLWKFARSLRGIPADLGARSPGERTTGLHRTALVLATCAFLVMGGQVATGEDLSTNTDDTVQMELEEVKLFLSNEGYDAAVDSVITKKKLSPEAKLIILEHYADLAAAHPDLLKQINDSAKGDVRGMEPREFWNEIDPLNPYSPFNHPIRTRDLI